MKIVIDIPEAVIDRAKGKDGLKLCDIDTKFICNQVANGTPLPKGHGDLIDREVAYAEFDKACLSWEGGLLKYVPTVIPADTEK